MLPCTERYHHFDALWSILFRSKIAKRVTYGRDEYVIHVDLQLLSFLLKQVDFNVLIVNCIVVLVRWFPIKAHRANIVVSVFILAHVWHYLVHAPQNAGRVGQSSV